MGLFWKKMTKLAQEVLTKKFLTRKVLLLENPRVMLLLGARWPYRARSCHLVKLIMIAGSIAIRPDSDEKK